MKAAIDEFDIEVDVSDTTRLYDYATCREVRREEGKEWEKAQFMGLGGTDHLIDENMNIQVKTITLL